MLNYFTATFFLGSLLLCLNTLWLMEFPDEQMALLEAEVTHDVTCNSQHSQTEPTLPIISVIPNECVVVFFRIIVHCLH